MPQKINKKSQYLALKLKSLTFSSVLIIICSSIKVKSLLEVGMALCKSAAPQLCAQILFLCAQTIEVTKYDFFDLASIKTFSAVADPPCFLISSDIKQ